MNIIQSDDYVKDIEQSNFTECSKIVEDILHGKEEDIRLFLKESVDKMDFSDGKFLKNKRLVYSHINALFLNVLLNRLNEDPNYEKIGYESRIIICKLIAEIF